MGVSYPANSACQAPGEKNESRDDVGPYRPQTHIPGRFNARQRRGFRWKLILNSIPRFGIEEPC